MWTLMCLRFPFRLNLWPHWWQPNVFSPVCVIMCLCKLEGLWNLFSQMSHWGWSLMWAWRQFFSVKPFPQHSQMICSFFCVNDGVFFKIPLLGKSFTTNITGEGVFSCVDDYVFLHIYLLSKSSTTDSQLKGFSPVWILVWMFSVLFRLNLSPQWSQPNGLSPVCFITCIFKLFSQMSHWGWHLMWMWRQFFVGKLLPQHSQLSGLFFTWTAEYLSRFPSVWSFSHKHHS